MSNYGIVVIGRNEGTRLVHCLKTIRDLVPQSVPVVYVDSGSSDNSIKNAQSLGVHTIELDPSLPFTMARGRNVGFKFLEENYQLEYIQFLDGDCELVEGWIEKALQTFQSNEDSLAIVCGRRREKFLTQSIYTQLADLEWNKPIGEIKSCGGDFLVKVKAMQEVDGFNSALICGEEPEMCIRLHRRGWKIFCIDADMTRHDIAITKLEQWWKRAVRSGWACAQGVAMYGFAPEHYKLRESFLCWFWGPIWLLLTLSTVQITEGYSLLLLNLYVLQIGRTYIRLKKNTTPIDYPFLGALLFTAVKFPHVVGQLNYWSNRLRSQKATIIEYKALSQG
jgi:glycosyltransferase involved in cell wall biosynthesis